MSDTLPRKAVLFFSPFFYPENISTGRYNTHLALALRQAGYDVTAVCSYPFYPEWSVRTDCIQELSDIEIRRGGGRTRYPHSQVLRRLVLEFWFFLFVRKTIKSLAKRTFDVVIDIYPPNLFSLGALRKRSLKAPVVGIVHDLQGVMSQTKASLLRRAIGRLILPMEKKALQQCDRLIFLSNESLQFALDNYALDPDSCDVAYPFQSLPNVENAKVPATLMARGKTLVYSGALSEKQAPEDLLLLFDNFARRNRDYRAIIFSDGPIFDALKREYSASDSPVEFHGLVPDDELEGLLRSSSIQVIPQREGVSHGAFPSKLPNLITTGTAVFAITDVGSELEHILSRYSRGGTTNSWETDVVVHALENFASKVDSLVDDAGTEKDDRALRDLFRIERLCKIIGDSAEIAE